MIGLRGTRPGVVAFAMAGLVLAQLAGCSSCVKDEPPVETTGGRRPITLKAADKKLSQFSESGAVSTEDAASP